MNLSRRIRRIVRSALPTAKTESFVQQVTNKLPVHVTGPVFDKRSQLSHCPLIRRGTHNFHKCPHCSGFKPYRFTDSAALFAVTPACAPVGPIVISLRNVAQLARLRCSNSCYSADLLSISWYVWKYKWRTSNFQHEKLGNIRCSLYCLYTIVYKETLHFCCIKSTITAYKRHLHVV